MMNKKVLATAAGALWLALTPVASAHDDHSAAAAMEATEVAMDKTQIKSAPELPSLNGTCGACHSEDQAIRERLARLKQGGRQRGFPMHDDVTPLKM